MIVYGDLARRSTLAELVGRLERAVADATGVDSAREALIVAGQLEQAIGDAGANVEQVARWMAVTDAAASAFCALLRGSDTDERGAIRALVEGVDRDLDLTVVAPEGFAMYALYPEQYRASAQRWAQDEHVDTSDCVLVVGIRSIGTTLSAVVAATLHELGRSVRRVTVRPAGHPFDRSTSLPSAVLDGITTAIVVDEGPGLSGSSMSSVADALERGGIDRARIVFMPGHAGEPAHATPAHVRRRWAITRRVVTPLNDVRWAGDTIEQLLAKACSARAEHLVDVSGGAWREHAFASSEQWPAACARFERTKYLCRLDEGSWVLWKFTGLAGDAAAPTRWMPERIGELAGFTATRWVDGTRLTQADADAALLSWIARYVLDAARCGLDEHDRAAALARLAQTVECNAREALGDDAADRARPWFDMLDPGSLARASAGDGRMSPHELVRDADGRLWKVGGGGYDRDHTIVGGQSVEWDVAGTIVEWGLDADQSQRLLTNLATGGLGAMSGLALHVHLLGYAAFRLGQTATCADLESDAAERERLWRARTRYEATLRGLLDQDLSC